jgi:hypothetical protein
MRVSEPVGICETLSNALSNYIQDQQQIPHSQIHCIISRWHFCVKTLTIWDTGILTNALSGQFAFSVARQMSLNGRWTQTLAEIQELLIIGVTDWHVGMARADFRFISMSSVGQLSPENRQEVHKCLILTPWRVWVVRAKTERCPICEKVPNGHQMIRKWKMSGDVSENQKRR